MNAIILNAMFLAGSACVVASAFLVSIPLGLVVLGVPLVSISIHIQMKKAKA